MYLRRAVLVSCLAVALALAASANALAQAVAGSSINPFGYLPLIPSAPQSAPNVAPANGPLPPIGSGSSPQPVISGDSASMPAASGTAQSTPVNGTNFPTRNGQGSVLKGSTEDIPAERQTQGTPQPQPSGPHVVMQDKAAQEGPSSPSNGLKKTSLDIQSATNKPNVRPFAGLMGTNTVRLNGPTTTVRPFARYLVKLGVVFSTVLMIFAAYSVILGQRDGAARVVSTAAGLILLLMGYTIYKIVVMDTQLYGKSPYGNNADQNNHQAQKTSEPYATNNTPQMNNNATGRSSPARPAQPAAPYASDIINQTQ
jgi:hypothetical protein